MSNTTIKRNAPVSTPAASATPSTAADSAMKKSKAVTAGATAKVSSSGVTDPVLQNLLSKVEADQKKLSTDHKNAPNDWAQFSDDATQLNKDTAALAQLAIRTNNTVASGKQLDALFTNSKGALAAGDIASAKTPAQPNVDSALRAAVSLSANHLKSGIASSTTTPGAYTVTLFKGDGSPNYVTVPGKSLPKGANWVDVYRAAINTSTASSDPNHLSSPLQALTGNTTSYNLYNPPQLTGASAATALKNVQAGKAGGVAYLFAADRTLGNQGNSVVSRDVNNLTDIAANSGGKTVQSTQKEDSFGSGSNSPTQSSSTRLKAVLPDGSSVAIASAGGKPVYAYTDKSGKTVNLPQTSTIVGIDPKTKNYLLNPGGAAAAPISVPPSLFLTLAAGIDVAPNGGPPPSA
jgi:hypothetical protein